MFKYMQRLAIPTAMMCWATWYYAEVMQKPKSAQVLIQPVYSFLFILYLAICYMECRACRRQSATSCGGSEDGGDGRGKNLAMLVCLLATGIYLTLLYLLGFLVSSVLFLSLSFRYLGTRQGVLAASLAALIAVLLNGVFKSLLEVPLPTGVLWG